MLQRNPKGCQNFVLLACSEQFFYPLGVPNQLTVNFTSRHIFRLNTLKGTTIPLTKVILDCSILGSTKPRILTPKRYDDHPRHFYMGVPHGIVTLPELSKFR